ncbi:MAG: hypothetical protein JRG97_15475 [Deltaproteobacteria bacterium]|nr:hypothetical protein [Deltaproteobacteria bacterium]MBW2053784.1 hypothetical protein [Deltaproteobacteria bacterium]MBW2142433.1 hypothetical protein [Deltaproteobacteria bacterium]MBW2324531.1 hypothetical protein [Deltaproteobacteria bacterium]
MSSETPHELDRLFYPRSIAVVGASSKGGGMMQGHNYIIGCEHKSLSIACSA